MSPTAAGYYYLSHAAALSLPFLAYLWKLHIFCMFFQASGNLSVIFSKQQLLFKCFLAKSNLGFLPMSVNKGWRNVLMDVLFYSNKRTLWVRNKSCERDSDLFSGWKYNSNCKICRSHSDTYVITMTQTELIIEKFHDLKLLPLKRFFLTQPRIGFGSLTVNLGKTASKY